MICEIACLICNIDLSVAACTSVTAGVDLHVACRLVGLVVKASAARAEDPGVQSPLMMGFFWVESYQ